MSGIYGLLGLADTDRAYVNTIGQRVVYDAIQEELARHNAELQAALDVFVQETTEDFKERYKLPGGGYLQKRAGQSQSGAVKTYGSWDVAFPLEDYGAQVAGDDVSFAYMTVKELNTHLDTVFAQDINTVRYEMLKALLDNGTYTFKDPIHGDLTVQPLANGDGTLYPPVLGSDTEADDTHHLGANYTAGSANFLANDPLASIKDELEEHFGAATGGENIAVFFNATQTPYVEAISGFTKVSDLHIQPGQDTAQVTGLPARMPGRIIGRGSGCWGVEWRWMPANYMMGVYLDAAKPLKMRVDPADTGLGRGLQLIARETDYPLQSSHYRHRFGFGVGNRLNGFVYYFTGSTSYSVPTGYDRA